MDWTFKVHMDMGSVSEQEENCKCKEKQREKRTGEEVKKWREKRTWVKMGKVKKMKQKELKVKIWGQVLTRRLEALTLTLTRDDSKL